MRSGRTSLAGPATATFVAIVLCALVPIWLTASTGNGHIPAWTLAVLVLAGLRFAVVVGSTRRRLFEMTVWLFTYVFMGMAAYVQQRLGVDTSNTANVGAEYLEKAGQVTFAGCLALIVGVWAASRRRMNFTRKATQLSRQRVNLLTFAAFALFLYYASAVGFSTLLADRSTLSAARAAAWPDSSTNAIIGGAVTMSLLVAFVSQMRMREENRRTGYRSLSLAPVITGAVLLYAVNPISSPRYIFGTVALAVLATLGAYATVARFRTVSITAMLGLVAVFPIADVFRHSTDNVSVSFQHPLAVMTTGDFDAFAQLANTIEYTEANGVTNGQQFLGVLLFWVPRSIWPGKPEDTGVVVAEFKGYDFTNLSSPIWAEFWVNGGWAALIVGMFAVGYFLRTMDRKTEFFMSQSRIPSVAACILPFYLLIILRGSMLAAVAYLSVVLICVWFVDERRRPGSGRPTLLQRRPARVTTRA